MDEDIENILTADRMIKARAGWPDGNVAEGWLHQPAGLMNALQFYWRCIGV